MTKRIGIITTFKANNYGAELQAFALQKKLRLMGYDAELIDYLFYKNKGYVYSKNSTPWKNFGLKDRIKHYLLYRVLNPFIAVWGNCLSSTMRQRTKNFREFHQNYSHMSKTYCSMDDLYAADLNYDVYCVGSDQVWNPATAISIEPYFLTFAPKDANKISYASSFGVSTLPSETRQKYANGLNNLGAISCREEEGVKLVKELTGRDATHVVDPTLLLKAEEWKSISKSSLCPTDSKYILLYNIYELGSIYQLARRISRELGWPILKLCKRGFLLRKHKGVKNIPSAGPADFVGLIENAGLLLTNSFHGCAFAVNLQTPFWVILDQKASNNSRLYSFLKRLHLENRVLEDTNLSNFDYLQNINYDNVSESLEAWRKKSLAYLKSAINGKDNYVLPDA